MELKEMLIALHRGQEVVLDEKENQYGERVTIDSIYFKDGGWWRVQLNCWSSYDFGFGTCRCQSHQPFRTTRISRKEALGHVRQILRNETEDRAKRDQEISWLEEQVALQA